MAKNSFPSVIIKSWNDFEEKINNHLYRDWVYRGQSEVKWPIESSLRRVYNDIISIKKLAFNKTTPLPYYKHEQLLIDKFKSHAHLYVDYLPDEDENLEWLAIMQHYGAPTRLIDVSFSPYIALYFALETGTSDATVFSFRHCEYKEIDEDNLDFDIDVLNIFGYEKKKDTFFCVYEPQLSNERLMAQQGLFIVPSKISIPFIKIFDDYEHSDNESFQMIIPAKLRLEFSRRLRKMNITSSALFPGIDGFCRSLKIDPLESAKRMGPVR